jgi:hypothetical protein
MRKLWKYGLVEGYPDGMCAGIKHDTTQWLQNNPMPELKTSELGKALLEDIKNDTGFYFHPITHELVSPYDDTDNSTVVLH